MIPEIMFEHSAAEWAIWSALGASALIGAFLYWRYATWSWATLAMALLRLLFLAVLGWCLLRPMARESHVEMLRPRFVVGIDTSGSMALAPGPAVPNRWSTVQRVMAQPWTNAIAAQCLLDVYSFASDMGAKLPLSDVHRLIPEGKSTHLRDSVTKLVERYRGQNLCAMLLLTDGLDTSDPSLMWARQSWPCPIYTVRIEPVVRWEQKPEVRIDSVETPRRVTVGWSSELKAVISGEGTQGQLITVQLAENGNPVQELPTQIPAEGGTREVVFPLKHEAVGTFNYTVQIPPLAGELNTNDNAYVVTVQVMDTKNQLLYVDGVPRWESKYLIRTLQAIHDISAVSFVRGPDGKFLSYGTRIGGPTLDLTEEQLSRFKIVILGDLDREALSGAPEAALVKFVENGGSLVLLGGPAAWGPKGFESLEFGQLLPARRSGTPPALEGKFELHLTDEGKSHPAFAAESDVWASLPPLLSVFPGAAPSAGAIQLVTATTPTGEQPVILAQRFGQGKVLALLTDSLWRWQLNPGKENQHYRFWNQILHWMLPSEGEAEAYQIDLFADSDRLFLGESITLNARITAAAKAGEEVPAPTCEIQAPDGRRIPFSMVKQNVSTAAGKSYSGYSTPFTAETSGLHRAVASISVDGKRFDSPPYSFFVKPFTPESNPRPANIELLKTLASESKGKFCEPEEVTRVLSSLRIATSQEERITYHTLWNSWYVIACLIALLAVEWVFRKLRNMA